MFRRFRRSRGGKQGATGFPRVPSVLEVGTIWKGRLGGRGGVRIEGTYEGEIDLNGTLVIGETGRVTCDHVAANIIIVAGILRGSITAQRVEIRATGRIWGDVITKDFHTEDGAFLRGKITVENEVMIFTDSDEEEGEELTAQNLSSGESVPAETDPSLPDRDPDELNKPLPGEDPTQ